MADYVYTTDILLSLFEKIVTDRGLADQQGVD